MRNEATAGVAAPTVIGGYAEDEIQARSMFITTLRRLRRSKTAGSASALSSSSCWSRSSPMSSPRSVRRKLGFNLLGDGLRDALDPRLKP
jgi:hypothetical protein